MIEMNEKEYNPLLPYDITFGETLRLYDNMTYKRDMALCNADTVRIESGNVYKYYACLNKEPYKIGGD